MNAPQSNVEKPQEAVALPRPCSAFILSHFPRPRLPRKKHRCRICGQIIAIKEPCCIWSGVTAGEGFWTCHAHPECFDVTETWGYGDWEITEPGDESRPAQPMYWPNAEVLATADNNNLTTHAMPTKSPKPKVTPAAAGCRADAECSALPCAPGSNWYRAGDKLKISHIEWGHVFAYWEGPTSPNMQYPCCIGCGQPFHVVRDEHNVQADPQNGRRKPSTEQ